LRQGQLLESQSSPGTIRAVVQDDGGAAGHLGARRRPRPHEPAVLLQSEHLEMRAQGRPGFRA
jgi:hypothetical protein